MFDSTSRGPSGAQIPGPKFRVVPITGLQRPYGMAFLPDGRILVTERAGRIRIISGNAVDPQPVSGVPPVLNRNLRGLNDIALHPKFKENGWVYFTYYKPHSTQTDAATATLARGTYDGAHALTNVTDIFTADTYVTGPSSAKILFAPDGTLFMAIGVPIPPSARPGVATPRSLPAHTTIAVFACGTSARTAELRGYVDRLAASAPREHRACIGDLAAIAVDAAGAVQRSDRGLFIEAIRRASRALARLGAAAGVPIVPEGFELLEALAAAEGGAFCVSGAGGGDVATYVGSARPSAAFVKRALALGLFELDLELDEKGARTISVPAAALGDAATTERTLSS